MRMPMLRIIRVPAITESILTTQFCQKVKWRTKCTVKAKREQTRTFLPDDEFKPHYCSAARIGLAPANTPERLMVGALRGVCADRLTIRSKAKEDKGNSQLPKTWS